MGSRFWFASYCCRGTNQHVPTGFFFMWYPSQFCNMRGAAMRRALRLQYASDLVACIHMALSFRALPAPHLGRTLISREIAFVGLQNNSSVIVKPKLECLQQEPHLSCCDCNQQPSSFAAEDLSGFNITLL